MTALAQPGWRRLCTPHPAAAATIAVAAGLVVAPLVSLIVTASQGDAGIWPHLVTYVFPQALLDTTFLLAGVAAVTTITGIGGAWIVTAYRFPGRNAFTWLLALPLAFPTYVVAYVYADTLDAVGPVQSALRAVFGWQSPTEYWFPSVHSLPGAIFVMGFVLYPYVYLAARVMFQTQSTALIETARLLGARRWPLMRDIALPSARPAIAAGLALALLEALNDIGASEYLGVRTLTLSVFTTWLNRSSLPGAAQIACLMLFVVAALIALERYGRRRQQFIGLDQRPGATDRIALTGWRRWFAFTACATPVALGFLVPMVFLAHEVIARGLLIGFDPQLASHTLNTVLIAGSATALTLALGFGAVFALRISNNWWPARTGVFLAGLGYALPGTVLALGLLSPLIAFDEALNWLTRIFFDISVGLVLAGSSAALVIAYSVRFLAIATGFAQSGLARIPTEWDDAARTLGMRPAGVVWSVQLPLLRPTLWGAALLIFVDCMKELPATLLLRPLNVETLSTYLYQFATRGDFEEGSLAALLIVLVGIYPVIRMVHLAEEVIRADAGQIHN